MDNEKEIFGGIVVLAIGFLIFYDALTIAPELVGIESMIQTGIGVVISIIGFWVILSYQ